MQFNRKNLHVVFFILFDSRCKKCLHISKNESSIVLKLMFSGRQNIDLNGNDDVPNIPDNDDAHLWNNRRNIFYGKLPILPDQKVSDVLDIQVTQTCTPYRFWYQLTENMERFDQFMKNIHRFYKEMERGESDDLFMSKTQMKVGRICAAKFSKKWHRASIVNLDDLDENRVKVFYVDYGTTEFADASEMAFLHEFFSKLPTQVFRGCVDGIRPNNKLDFWSLGACTQFSKLTNSWGAEGKRKCIGEITAINEKDKIYYLHIFDEPIGRNLIERGFAIPVNMPIFSPEKRLHCESYPDFDSLEKGIAPSYKEMRENDRLLRADPYPGLLKPLRMD